MGLLEIWREQAYDQQKSKQDTNRLWSQYFQVEKGIYQQILQNPDIVVQGTVKELAERFETDVFTMTGFLDGINESLTKENHLEENLSEESKVSLSLDLEKLYKNMVAAKADWLYNLEEWEKLIPESHRKELYHEQKAAGTVVKDEKIGRNDPCPCNSGKKYKKCCGKSQAS
ncbi:hypothetical protein FACS189418_5510 [Clostridia bacterium]|nr:hypothetical protein FACS189418_5510 [Clostridia bacterium]